MKSIVVRVVANDINVGILESALWHYGYSLAKVKSYKPRKRVCRCKVERWNDMAGMYCKWCGGLIKIKEAR